MDSSERQRVVCAGERVNCTQRNWIELYGSYGGLTKRGQLVTAACVNAAIQNVPDNAPPYPGSYEHFPTCVCKLWG